MHSLNYAPGSFGGEGEREGGLLFSHSVARTVLLGRRVCSYALRKETFTGVQPLLELESYEKLEQPPGGETDAMDWTLGGWGFRETWHLLGLCTDPECPPGPHICPSQ